MKMYIGNLNDFSFCRSSQFAGEQIPTLQEALDLCEELDLLLFIDLKGGSTPEVMTTIIHINFHFVAFI